MSAYSLHVLTDCEDNVDYYDSVSWDSLRYDDIPPLLPVEDTMMLDGEMMTALELDHMLQVLEEKTLRMRLRLEALQLRSLPPLPLIEDDAALPLPPLPLKDDEVTLQLLPLDGDVQEVAPLPPKEDEAALLEEVPLPPLKDEEAALQLLPPRNDEQQVPSPLGKAVQVPLPLQQENATLQLLRKEVQLQPLFDANTENCRTSMDFALLKVQTTLHHHT
jgi:hypothetical protein